MNPDPARRSLRILDALAFSFGGVALAGVAILAWACISWSHPGPATAGDCLKVLGLGGVLALTILLPVPGVILSLASIIMTARRRLPVWRPLSALLLNLVPYSILFLYDIWNHRR